MSSRGGKGEKRRTQQATGGVRSCGIGKPGSSTSSIQTFERHVKSPAHIAAALTFFNKKEAVQQHMRSRCKKALGAVISTTTSRQPQTYSQGVGLPEGDITPKRGLV
jgi:hypothetical protein